MINDIAGLAVSMAKFAARCALPAVVVLLPFILLIWG